MTSIKPEQQDRRQAMEQIDKINQETLFGIQVQVGIMRDENQQVLALVQNATSQLSTSFNQINVLAQQAQSQLDVSTQAAIQSQVEQTVTALQFDDMCSQLVTHIDKRLNVLAELTQVLSALSLFELDVTNIDQYQAQLDYAKKLASELGGALKSVSHNPVSQHTLDTGEVDLF